MSLGGLLLALALTQGQADLPVKAKLQMPEEHGGIWALAIAPDGKVVAGATGVVKMTFGGRTKVSGGEVLLWDPATGKIRKSLGKHAAAPEWVAFARDGKTLGSLSKEDGEFKLWDLGTGKLLQTVKLGVGVDADAKAVAFDGRTLVTVERKSVATGKEGMSFLVPGAFTARDPRTGKTTWSLNDSGVVVAGLSPDGKTLAVFVQQAKIQGGDFKVTDRAVKLLDAQTGKETKVLELGEVGYADQIGFTPDGKTAFLYHDGELFRWNLEDGKPQPKLEMKGWKGVSALAFGSDGRTAGIVDFMGEKAGVLDLTTGKASVEVSAKFPDNFKHPAFSADLRLLACSRDLEPVLLGVPGGK